MNKGEMLYSGKAKSIYKTDDPALVIISYRDDATADNGMKKGSFQDKGVLNNAISAIIYDRLAKAGIPTHFVKALSQRDTLAKKVAILPLEVIVRNVAAGSFSKKYGVDEGTALACPTLEYSYKRDDLGDPLIARSHILAMELATEQELDLVEDLTLRINDLLIAFFAKAGMRLIDFKLEFGKTPDGAILLADEISPDTCRLWDSTTGEKLDKDRFRRDMGGFAQAYAEVFARIQNQ